MPTLEADFAPPLQGTVEAVTVPATATTATGNTSRLLEHVQFTADVSVTATTEGTANTVVALAAHDIFDGTTPYLLEVQSPRLVYAGGSAAATFVLYEDGASVGLLGSFAAASNVAVRLAHRFTPTAGTHTYSVRAYTDAGTLSVRADTGGITKLMPGWVRMTEDAVAT